jgi:hypothetical protein
MMALEDRELLVDIDARVLRELEIVRSRMEDALERLAFIETEISVRAQAESGEVVK